MNANGVAWVVARESFLDGPPWLNESATTFGEVTLYYDVGRTANTFEVLSGIHNDYRNSTSLYENHTSYDCLKAYMNPLNWRPRLLIMVSSDEDTAMKGYTYLDWGIRSETPGEEAHFLCDGDPTMSEKCAAIDKLTSQTTGPITFRGHTIDYCLFKPVEVYESQVKTCHLQGSPQILLGRLPPLFDKTLLMSLKLRLISCCNFQYGQVLLHPVDFAGRSWTYSLHVG